MRADFFELADVALLLVFGGEQRPDLGDLFTPDVQHAGALRRVQPFVQAGAKIIAVQVRLLEIELSKGMRAVNNRLDAPGARHFADGLDRSDLSGDVYLMGDLNQPRARRNGAFEGAGDLVDVLRWNRNLDQVEFYAFALLTLSDGREHACVILRRREHLVAGLQVHAEQESLQ